MAGQHTANFLNQLATDARAREEYQQDPEAFMTKHGLTDEDKEVLASKDPDRIREHMGEDGPPGCFICIFF